MRTSIRQICQIGLISLIMVLLSWNSTHAQEFTQSLTISPPVIKLSLDPGKEQEGSIKLTNNSDASLTVRVTTQDFMVTDTKGTPVFLPDSSAPQQFAASSWIAVTPTTLTLQPHEQEKIGYYIRVPADARPGGRFAGLLLQLGTPTVASDNGASVESYIGTLIYLTVNGAMKEQAVITQFSTPGFHEYGPITVTTQIQNQGDNYITPQGYIEVKNMITGSTYRSTLAPENIFPLTARDYTNTIGKHFMLGYYRASLVAQYGSNHTLSHTISFWVIPWRLIIVLILLVITLFLGWKYWTE